MLCDVSGCKVHSTEVSFQNAIFYTGREGDQERYRRGELSDTVGWDSQSVSISRP